MPCFSIDLVPDEIHKISRMAFCKSQLTWKLGIESHCHCFNCVAENPLLAIVTPHQPTEDKDKKGDQTGGFMTKINIIFMVVLSSIIGGISIVFLLQRYMARCHLLWWTILFGSVWKFSEKQQECFFVFLKNLEKAPGCSTSYFWRHTWEPKLHQFEKNRSKILQWFEHCKWQHLNVYIMWPLEKLEVPNSGHK